MQEKQTKIASTIIRNKPLIIKTGLVVLVVAAVGGFVLYKQSNKTISSAEVVVPQAYASELPGWWYKQYFGISVCKSEDCLPEADPDKDKLTNQQEYFYHSNPMDAFSTKNKFNDGELVAQGINPSKPDTTLTNSTSDDVVVGESLLFAEDIKQQVQSSMNIDNVSIPLVPDSNLRIVSDNEVNAKIYFDELDRMIKNYFPEKGIGQVIDGINSENKAALNELSKNSALLALNLEDLSVPQSILSYHKYTIALFRLLPQVVNIPSDEKLKSDTDLEANIWYDNAQAFMAAMQRLETEGQLISRR